MGQKQTLAPMIDSGSCDRQSWRIVKMKLATGQTAAKSETKGFVLYYSGRQHVGLCGKGELCLVVLRQRPPRRRFLETVILRGPVSDSTAQPPLDIC